MAARINILLAAAALTFSSMAPARAQAEDKPPASPSLAHAAAPLPDISGIWLQGSNVKVAWFDAQSKRLDNLPMTAWGEARFQANKPTHGINQVVSTETNDPIASCLPPGVPAIYMMTYPMEIVQAPGRVIMIFEYDHYVRHIYTDGRPHQDLTPTWMGDSIGRWEGDTLVVDASGFNDKTWLDDEGHPHSDALHVVERLRRVDRDTMVDDITIEDPKAYTQPLKTQRTLLLKPNWTLAEYVCEDNAAFLDFQKRAGGEKK